MGAVEEDLERPEGYDPSISPRFIGGDVEPYAPDEETIRLAVQNLQLLEAGMVVLGHENWSFVDATLFNEVSRLEHELLYSQEGGAANVIRGRILALKWMRALPDAARAGMEANRQTIAREERGPEDEDGEE